MHIDSIRLQSEKRKGLPDVGFVTVHIGKYPTQ